MELFGFDFGYNSTIFDRLKKNGRLVGKPILINLSKVGCRSCDWVGKTEDCVYGVITDQSLSCPECGAFCGEESR